MKIKLFSVLKIYFYSTLNINYLKLSKRFQNKLYFYFLDKFQASNSKFSKSFHVRLLTKNLLIENRLLEIMTKNLLLKLLNFEDITSLKKFLLIHLKELHLPGNILKIYLISKLLQNYGEFKLAVVFENVSIKNILNLKKYSLFQVSELLLISAYYNQDIFHALYKMHPKLYKITPYKILFNITNNISKVEKNNIITSIFGPFLEDLKITNEDIYKIFFIRITPEQYSKYKNLINASTNKLVYYYYKSEYYSTFREFLPFKDEELLLSVDCNKNILTENCIDENIGYLLINGYPQAIQRVLLHQLNTYKIKQITLSGVNFYLGKQYPKEYANLNSSWNGNNSWHSLISNYRLIENLVDKKVLVSTLNFKEYFDLSLEKAAEVYEEKSKNL